MLAPHLPKHHSLGEPVHLIRKDYGEYTLNQKNPISKKQLTKLQKKAITPGIAAMWHIAVAMFVEEDGCHRASANVAAFTCETRRAGTRTSCLSLSMGPLAWLSLLPP